MTAALLVLALSVAGAAVFALRGRFRGEARAPEWLGGTYTHFDGRRDYKLYVPAAHHARSRPLPLVVMLHGCQQDPDDFAAGTAMNALAERGPFLVVYPAQDAAANSQRCWNWFQPAHQMRDRGEPALIAGIARQVMSRYRVDPRRVYAAGMSAGAGMAVILAMTYPDLFAAAGAHSGIPYKAARSMWSGWLAMKGGAADPEDGARAAVSLAEGARVVPLIVFHGDADQATRVRNADQLVAQWERLHTLAGGAPGGLRKEEVAAGAEPNGHACRRTLHRDASGRIVVEKWIVHAMPHAWSGGDPAGSFTYPAGPSASREMIRFFGDHVLPR